MRRGQGLRRGRSAVQNAADTEALECPLCLELPEGVVHRCSNGHNFCADCLTKHRESGRPSSSKCPSCRVTLGDPALWADPLSGPHRNRDAELRISRLPGVCEGCCAGMLRKDLVPHMAVCGDVVVDCPFPGCSVRVPRRELAAHMTEANEQHVAIAQAQHKKLETAQRALNTIAIGVKVELHAHTIVDGVTSPILRRVAAADVVLRIMEPIERQHDFVTFLSDHVMAHDHVLTDCTVNVDTSKSIFELGIEHVHTIKIVSPTAHPLPSGGLGEHDTLNLKVVAPDGSEVFFKCKPTTEMSKLMDAFCTRQGLAAADVRFLFDGDAIRREDTPQSLQMEDGDSIDVAMVADLPV